MGRELRRVPANWEHPQEDRPTSRGSWEKQYTPLFDEDYESAIKEWVDGYLLWQKGEHPDQAKDYVDADTKFNEWHGEAPHESAYRPKWEEGAATWWQVYETVSEGTPVTPPFETQAELVDYLVENGDFWDQKRRAEPPSPFGRMPCDPWKRENAEKFVYSTGWAPSIVVANGKVMGSSESMELVESKPD